MPSCGRFSTSPLSASLVRACYDTVYPQTQHAGLDIKQIVRRGTPGVSMQETYLMPTKGRDWCGRISDPEHTETTSAWLGTRIRITAVMRAQINCYRRLPTHSLGRYVRSGLYLALVSSASRTLSILNVRCLLLRWSSASK